MFYSVSQKLFRPCCNFGLYQRFHNPHSCKWTVKVGLGVCVCLWLAEANWLLGISSPLFCSVLQCVGVLKRTTHIFLGKLSNPYWRIVRILLNSLNTFWDQCTAEKKVFESALWKALDIHVVFLTNVEHTFFTPLDLYTACNIGLWDMPSNNNTIGERSHCKRCLIYQNFCNSLIDLVGFFILLIKLFRYSHRLVVAFSVLTIVLAINRHQNAKKLILTKTSKEDEELLLYFVYSRYRGCRVNYHIYIAFGRCFCLLSLILLMLLMFVFREFCSFGSVLHCYKMNLKKVCRSCHMAGWLFGLNRISFVEQTTTTVFDEFLWNLVWLIIVKCGMHLAYLLCSWVYSLLSYLHLDIWMSFRGIELSPLVIVLACLVSILGHPVVILMIVLYQIVMVLNLV